VRRLWADFKIRHAHRTDLLWQMFTLVAWSRHFQTIKATTLSARL